MLYIFTEMQSEQHVMEEPKHVNDVVMSIDSV